MNFSFSQIINKFLPSKVINADSEPVPTKVVATTIAQPTDIQYVHGDEVIDGHLPTKLAGKNATEAVAVTPSDTTDLTDGVTNGIYLGVSGDVVVTMSNGVDATFKGLVSGVIHPISCIRVKATGTTAINILAIY